MIKAMTPAGQGKRAFRYRDTITGERSVADVLQLRRALHPILAGMEQRGAGECGGWGDGIVGSHSSFRNRAHSRASCRSVFFLGREIKAKQ